MGSEGVNTVMKQIAKALQKKILLYLAGTLGLSGGAILIVVLLIVLIVIGASGSQTNSDSSLSLGGQFSCSPTGEINEQSWEATFTRSGVLAGRGDEIKSIAEEKGIDPVLFAAISMNESTRGTSNAIVAYNNPGGLMNPKTGKLFRFGSLTEGLQSMGRTLYNRIRVDGLTTIEKLGGVYAPVGAANDPTNLNSHWVPTVTSIASELGGLTMNCEADIITGDWVDSGSTSGVKVVDVGNKWLNKTVYKWGGGRNQGDIALGLFDCSSFVHWAFSQVGIQLGPVTSVSTETLKNVGKPVARKDMRPGDIVFFNSYKTNGHVGIYVGGGKFIGDQSSSGVAIADMTKGYWGERFNGNIRRVN